MENKCQVPGFMIQLNIYGTISFSQVIHNGAILLSALWFELFISW
jgi:hypothetical protein